MLTWNSDYTVISFSFYREKHYMDIRNGDINDFC